MTRDSSIHPFPRAVDPLVEADGEAQTRNAAADLTLQLAEARLDEGPPVCLIGASGELLYNNQAFDAIKRGLAAVGLLPNGQSSRDPTALDRVTILTAGKRQHFRCQSKALRGVYGGATAYIFDPISEEAQALQRHEHLAKRLSDLTRLVSDWVWETDSDLNLTYISPRVTELLGFIPEQLMGRPLQALVIDAPEKLEKLLHAGGRSPFRDEQIQLKSQSGDLRQFLLSGLPVYNSENGAFVGLRGTACDVTALKAHEASLVAAKETAELANRSKSEFLANMSHELRTPLNAVIGFSEVMHDELLGPLGNDQYKSYTKDIHDSATHLLSLINDILDIAKIESGEESLQEEEMDPTRVIQSAERLVHERCMKAGLRFTVDCPQSLPRVFADERKLKQVLLNLLANAIKFTQPGGAVSLSVHHAPGEDLVFAVRDEGIGIAPKDIERAFHPFAQIDSQLNRQFEGTGLGLPLSRGFSACTAATLPWKANWASGQPRSRCYLQHGFFSSLRLSPPSRPQRQAGFCLPAIPGKRRQR